MQDGALHDEAAHRHNARPATTPEFAVILRHAFIPSDNERIALLCGALDEHLRSIEAGLEVSISRRNASFRIEGATPHAQRAAALLQSMYERARRPISIYESRG